MFLLHMRKQIRYTIRAGLLFILGRNEMRKKLQDLTIKDAFMFAAVMSDAEK